MTALSQFDFSDRLGDRLSRLNWRDKERVIQRIGHAGKVVTAILHGNVRHLDIACGCEICQQQPRPLFEVEVDGQPEVYCPGALYSVMVVRVLKNMGYEGLVDFIRLYPDFDVVYREVTRDAGTGDNASDDSPEQPASVGS